MARLYHNCFHLGRKGYNAPMKRCLRKLSSASIKMLNSEFIGYAFPIKDVESFKKQYEEIVSSHPKADHIPYAYSLGNKTKSSDDGEPSGTAGRPLLSLLQNREFDGMSLVVVRYFGGTKLGTGRLRRCFVDAATLALDQGEIGFWKEEISYSLESDYSAYQKLLSFSKKKGFHLKPIDFSAKVIMEITGDDTIPLSLEKEGFDVTSLKRVGSQMVFAKEEES